MSSLTATDAARLAFAAVHPRQRPVNVRQGVLIDRAAAPRAFRIRLDDGEHCNAYGPAVDYSHAACYSRRWFVEIGRFLDANGRRDRAALLRLDPPS